MFDWLYELGSYIFRPIWCGVRRAFCWVIQWFVDLGAENLTELAAEIPDLSEYSNSLILAVSTFSVLGGWIPFDTIIGVAVVVYGFGLGLVTLRWVKSWIPFLGR